MLAFPHDQTALHRPRLGVLGGMGPLASSAFLSSVYEHACAAGVEQATPSIAVVSEPNVADRTASLLSGREWALVEALNRGIEQLGRCGAQRFVICCFTAHSVVHRLPEVTRGHLLSLPRILLQACVGLKGDILLACTEGARSAGVFQRYPEWEQLEQRVRFPSAAGQERVHELIYGLKRNASVSWAQARLLRLLRDEGAAYLACGCTELHLVTRAARVALVNPFIDALEILARSLPHADRLPTEVFVS